MRSRQSRRWPHRAGVHNRCMARAAFPAHSSHHPGQQPSSLLAAAAGSSAALCTCMQSSYSGMIMMALAHRLACSVYTLLCPPVSWLLWRVPLWPLRVHSIAHCAPTSWLGRNHLPSTVPGNGAGRHFSMTGKPRPQPPGGCSPSSLWRIGRPSVILLLIECVKLILVTLLLPLASCSICKHLEHSGTATTAQSCCYREGLPNIFNMSQEYGNTNDSIPL
jgi:hypothetical protein